MPRLEVTNTDATGAISSDDIFAGKYDYPNSFSVYYGAVLEVSGADDQGRIDVVVAEMRRVAPAAGRFHANHASDGRRIYIWAEAEIVGFREITELTDMNDWPIHDATA